MLISVSANVQVFISSIVNLSLFSTQGPEVHHLSPISGVWEDGTQSGDSGKSTYTAEIGTEMENLRAPID